MKNKNPVIVETLRILLGQVICLGLMLGVYALIHRFSVSVLLGGIVGTLLSVGNFFFMAVGLSNLAADASDARFKIRAQGSYLIRTLAIFGIAVVAIKFGGCDVVATLLPLLLVRPILMVEQFILRSSSANVPVKADAETEQESCEEIPEEKEGEDHGA